MKTQVTEGTREALRRARILVAKWGYDQTNVTYYRVLKVTKTMVELQEIGTAHNETGFMAGLALPDEGTTYGAPIRRRIGTAWGTGEPQVKITDYQYARVWDGTPQTYTAYA